MTLEVRGKKGCRASIPTNSRPFIWASSVTRLNPVLAVNSFNSDFATTKRAGTFSTLVNSPTT